MVISSFERFLADREYPAAVLWARHYETLLRANLPLQPLDYFERFIEGDRWIGRSLVSVAPRRDRGYLVLWLYYSFKIGQITQALFRDLLAFAWHWDHHPLLAAASWDRPYNQEIAPSSLGRSLVGRMFREAGFPLPIDITPTTEVEIWRGALRPSLSATRSGFSWTRIRDFACFCALYNSRHRGEGAWQEARGPFVIKARIAAAELIFLPNERGECEALHFGAPIGEVDGDAADWRLGAYRWRKRPHLPSSHPLPMPMPRALQVPGADSITVTDNRP